jgi:hypothetical protein
MGIAKHYETGESLPEEVYLKLLAARTFRAGSLSLRQVISSLRCFPIVFLSYFFGFMLLYVLFYFVFSLAFCG